MSHTDYMREWRAKHPEHREYMREWRKANAEHLKAWRHARYEANRAQEIADAVRWQKTHVIEAAICQKVAAAHRRYPGRITAQDIRDVIARVGWVCCWCKKSIVKLRDFQLEHLRPVNDPMYLSIACHSCNSAKVPSSGVLRRTTPEEQRIKNAPRKRAYDKQWKLENRERQNDLQRARYWAKVDEHRAYFREWQRRKRERDQNSH